ncbi:MAG: ribosome small subunit-dependent GTPase A [bacterium]|nr:ribosome small subunit-dependent GTPase A [bacterium]
MLEARIIKLTGGLYTVLDQHGRLVECRPLGIFRHHNIKPKVGDFVEVIDQTITKVFERKNDFLRPAIANVDQVLLIQSMKEPDFSFLLLDRFLALIQAEEVDPIIIVTKTDLATKEELIEIKQKLDYYHTYFPVVYSSSKNGYGLEEIRNYTKGKVNVVAGQTGAGKSSLLNAMDPRLNLDTNEISKALGRGKHTTRTVELIVFDGGWIADTPGFSKLEFEAFEPSMLTERYPEFESYRGLCRFDGCSHIHEPNCAVKEAVLNKRILQERYDNYVLLYQEIKGMKPKYPR